MKKLLICLFMCLLGACSTPNPLSDYRFQTQTVPPYVVATWYKITKVGQPVRIYIEGDGSAFNVKGFPTDNPTPKDTFMRDLAANDPNPNVVYLGRPCQYLQTGACSQKDWTSGRFSQEIIASMERTALAYLKKTRTDKMVLIGFSGGAQIAGQIAVRNPQKTQYVITIAGVLDHSAWTNYHNDLPLTDSENLADNKAVFKKIAQHHFVGDKDTVVPVQLTQDFVQDNQKITIVKSATHNKGFEKAANEIYERGNK